MQRFFRLETVKNTDTEQKQSKHDSNKTYIEPANKTTKQITAK